jgi:hypothetical protein
MAASVLREDAAALLLLPTVGRFIRVFEPRLAVRSPGTVGDERDDWDERAAEKEAGAR